MRLKMFDPLLFGKNPSRPVINRQKLLSYFWCCKFANSSVDLLSWYDVWVDSTDSRRRTVCLTSKIYPYGAQDLFEQCHIWITNTFWAMPSHVWNTIQINKQNVILLGCFFDRMVRLWHSSIVVLKYIFFFRFKSFFQIVPYVSWEIFKLWLIHIQYSYIHI